MMLVAIAFQHNAIYKRIIDVIEVAPYYYSYTPPFKIEKVVLSNCCNISENDINSDINNDINDSFDICDNKIYYIFYCRIHIHNNLPIIEFINKEYCLFILPDKDMHVIYRNGYTDKNTDTDTDFDIDIDINKVIDINKDISIDAKNPAIIFSERHLQYEYWDNADNDIDNSYSEYILSKLHRINDIYHYIKLDDNIYYVHLFNKAGYKYVEYRNMNLHDNVKILVKPKLRMINNYVTAFGSKWLLSLYFNVFYNNYDNQHFKDFISQYCREKAILNTVVYFYGNIAHLVVYPINTPEYTFNSIHYDNVKTRVRHVKDFIDKFEAFTLLEELSN